jgi:hypothetical protein
MGTVPGRWTRLGWIVAIALVTCSLASADTWGRTFWEDDFQDGEYTSNPAWTTFGSSISSTTTTDLGGGQWVLEPSATYTTGGGWAGAYVDVIEGTQGISGFVDTSPLVSDQWTALCMLRYTATSSPGAGIGTGYALAVTNSASEGMVAQLYQLVDTSGYRKVTEAVRISTTYTDLQFRFLAMGAGSDISLLGKLWPDGTTEPIGWNLNSAISGPYPGVTEYYDTGRGGVGVVAADTGVTASAYFDDIRYGTPEPTSMLLLATGIGALVLRRRRGED